VDGKLSTIASRHGQRAEALPPSGILLLAVGVSAVSYFWTHLAISLPYNGRTTPVAAASYGLEFFGFLLAAIAFWGASSEVRSPLADQSLSEEDLAAV